MSFLFAFFFSSVEANMLVTNEKVTVRGKVMNEKKEPIIMAPVVVKDGNIGTISDIDGTFILEVPVNSTVVISKRGMTKFEVSVEEKDISGIEAILKPEEPETKE